MKMKAEIIAVGTEILLGQIVNTNATYLSQELANLGVDVYYHSVVGDNAQRLDEVLTEAEKRSEIIFLCGGLGPTEDDLTKQVTAKHLGEELVMDELALTEIVQHIERLGRKVTENNKRQALTIQNGKILANHNGLAIGTYYQGPNHHYILLPGPPSEMKVMFQTEVIPILQQNLPKQEQLFSRVLRFFGIGESQLVTELADLIDHQTNPTIAPYAKMNEVTLRLTAKIDRNEQAQKMLDDLEARVQQRVGAYFYGYGDDNSLVDETVKLLKAHKKTVTSAESLTAGMFQSTLGNVSGVSEVFAGGFVTYSKEAKVKLLNLSEEELRKHGVVSEYCAKQMAEQARSILDTDYAVSFTGVAGPNMLEDQEAGTVWIGVAARGEEPSASCFKFSRNRQAVRNAAIMNGLSLLRKKVQADTK